MKNNVLFTVTDKNLIEDLKGLGITNFVYPLSFFCVGILKTFSIEEINEEGSYIYINRILDTKDIETLNEILHNLPSNIKGIIFDDLGIIEILKDINIEKILYHSHFLTNYESINGFLEYVDSIIVSTDITEDEIDTIIKMANKKVSALVFGLVPAMYSRRTLLKSHSKYHNLDYADTKDLSIQEEKFITVENEFGTVLYHYPYLEASRLLEKDLKYYFYLPILLSKDEVLKVAQNDFSSIDTDTGFLDKKTIYKVKN